MKRKLQTCIPYMGWREGEREGEREREREVREKEGGMGKGREGVRGRRVTREKVLLGARQHFNTRQPTKQTHTQNIDTM